jgi:NAD+ kinase
LNKVAIYGRFVRDDDFPYIQEIIDGLEQRGVIVSLVEDYFNLIKDRVSFQVQPKLINTQEELRSSSECVISLGGDGTLLNLITLTGDSNIPIAGINLGRLGFLASISKDNISQIIEEISEQSCKIENKSLIKLNSDKMLFNGVSYAINEFAIHKKDTSSMIVIHTYIDGEFLNSYWADGLIVATPTGSTAYSLSCGGPIIYPGSGCFVITPVAPHNLNLRPIVVSDDCEISFRVEGRSDSFLCTLDSRSEVIDSTFRLSVRKADFNTRLIRLKEDDYKQTLREKMMWGLDKRNNLY